MLVDSVRTGCSPTSFTPTAAARWNTTSDSATSCSSSGASLAEPVKKVSASLPSRWARLPRRPVERSSRTRTRQPQRSSSSVRWEPMKPAPPVTSARGTIPPAHVSLHATDSRVAALAANGDGASCERRRRRVRPVPVHVEGNEPHAAAGAGAGQVLPPRGRRTRGGEDQVRGCEPLEDLLQLAVAAVHWVSLHLGARQPR